MAMSARQILNRLTEIDTKLEEVDFDIEFEGRHAKDPNEKLQARRDALIEEMQSLRKSLKLLIK